MRRVVRLLQLLPLEILILLMLINFGEAQVALVAAKLALSIEKKPLVIELKVIPIGTQPLQFQDIAYVLKDFPGWELKLSKLTDQLMLEHTWLLNGLLLIIALAPYAILFDGADLMYNVILEWK